MSKNKRPSYKNLKCIPTWKIEAILEHPHHQGIDGADYGPVAHELQDILFERKNKAQDWLLRKARYGLDGAIKSYEKKPAVKAIVETEHKAIEVEYWKMPNGGLLAIPPMILPF